MEERNDIVVVDARGKECPLPLIMTRKALRGAAPGNRLRVLVDNPTSRDNLLAFLKELKCDPSAEENGNGEFAVLATVSAEGVKAPESAAACPAPAAPAPAENGVRRGYVVVLGSDRMGSGDDELGAILMKAFVNSLGEQDVLPEHVLCYNGGVKLLLPEASTSQSLAALAERGVDVVACGTCLNFYDIKEKIATGRVGNMFLITELMAGATSLVKP